MVPLQALQAEPMPLQHRQKLVYTLVPHSRNQRQGQQQSRVIATVRSTCSGHTRTLLVSLLFFAPRFPEIPLMPIPHPGGRATPIMKINTDTALAADTQPGPSRLVRGNDRRPQSPYFFRIRFHRFSITVGIRHAPHLARPVIGKRAVARIGRHATQEQQ